MGQARREGGPRRPLARPVAPPCHPRTHAHTGPTNVDTVAAVAAPPSAAPATSFTRAALSKGVRPRRRQRPGADERGEPSPLRTRPRQPPTTPSHTARPPRPARPAFAWGRSPGRRHPVTPRLTLVCGGGEPWRIFLGASVKKGEEREDGRRGGRGEGQGDAHSTKNRLPSPSLPPSPFPAPRAPLASGPSRPLQVPGCGQLARRPQRVGCVHGRRPGGGERADAPPSKTVAGEKKKGAFGGCVFRGRACAPLPGVRARDPDPPRPAPAQAEPSLRRTPSTVPIEGWSLSNRGVAR